MPGWARAAQGFPAYGAPGATPPPETGWEIDMLKQEAEIIGSRLEEIRSRIKELENNDTQKQ
jgi:hypothetical protein